MSKPVNPTPVNPTKAEDRTWRLEMLTDYRTDYAVNAYRERIEMDNDGNPLIPARKENIDAGTSDGGKPTAVSFKISDVLGVVGQGRDITVPASEYGAEVTFKLSKIGEIIVAALESVAADNAENRKLYRQLQAGQITQEEYDTAVALLIQTQLGL